MTWPALEGIVRASHYMTLATADLAGLPWASPVWFASDDCCEYFWASRPSARHSRNLTARPELAISIFDSRQAPGTGHGVYLWAVAGLVADHHLDEGMQIYSRGLVRAGLAPWARRDVEAPARLRLYHATVRDHFVLDQDEHRVRVTPAT